MKAALATIVLLLLVESFALPTEGASVAGSAGIDTSLPATSSKVSVSGRGLFSSLKITVNQTKDLVNQAVSVGWTGGRPTRAAPSRFGANYLQLMECWGDDDGTVKDNPGPPPSQCVQGATQATYGGTGDTSSFPGGSFTTERIISNQGWANFDPKLGVVDQSSGQLWMPFKSVKGSVIGVEKDNNFNPQVEGGNYWLNDFFNIVTTNEIPGARTGPNGTGAELFTVNTGRESSGLGCGLKVEPVAGGDARVPKCWLVIVPRGTPIEENVGTPFDTNPVADQRGVVTSPLTPTSWKNRIAIPLEFNPVDSPCNLNSDQRRIVGSELSQDAVSSWQPTLCTEAGRLPYSYAIAGDATARQQLSGSAAGGPGMIVVSRPLTNSDPKNPVVYAPITVSATVIGFNVERVPKFDSGADEQALAGIRIADINLTPRLIAKLLSQSYTQQTAIGDKPPNPDWKKDNPASMATDKDFLQFNPEFASLQMTQLKNFGGFVMPARTSDASRQLWEYVLSDPEAKAWLDGTPDPWGMKVNPVYATKASANSNGVAFGDPIPEAFLKSDPYCFQAPARGVDKNIIPPPLCGTDWLPFSTSFADAARITRAADDGAKIVDNPFALSSDQVYRADIPQTLGTRAILSITDAASASRYGIQTARLSRSGDDVASRKFIAADAAGMTAGVDAMKPEAQPDVVEPDPTAKASTAYPLTAISYAAITPLSLDAKARDDFAAFVDYAAGKGQVPGPELGQLPIGYVPLPSALKKQAADAAQTIRSLTAASSTTTTTRPATAAPSSAGGGSGDASSSGSFSGGTGSGSGGGGSQSTTAQSTTAPTTVTATTRGTTTTVAATTQTVATPRVALASTRYALPGLAGIALLSSLAVLEISKRPRPRLPGRRP